MEKKTRRFTIDLNQKYKKQLDEVAEEEEVSSAEIVRRAISFYARTLRRVREGKTLFFKDKEGNLVEIDFI